MTNSPAEALVGLTIKLEISVTIVQKAKMDKRFVALISKHYSNYVHTQRNHFFRVFVHLLALL